MTTLVLGLLFIVILFTAVKAVSMAIDIKLNKKDLSAPFEGSIYDLDATPSSIFDGAPYMREEDILRSIAEGDAVDEVIDKVLAEGDIDALESANIDSVSGSVMDSLKDYDSGITPIGTGAPTGSFPNKLLANAALAKSKQKLGGKVSNGKFRNLSQSLKDKISNLARVSSSLVSKIKCSPIFVTGGMVKITPTDLKMSGGFLAAVHRDWWITWPGLSVTKTFVSTGADIVISFGTSAAEEIKRALPFIISFAAADLTRIREAEVTITATGKLQNGDVFNLRRTSMTLFTTPVEAMSQGTLFKTLMVLFPFIVQKQYLYPSPVLLDDANPFVITISGVPTGVQVIARAASVDSDDWRSFKNMISLE